MVVCITLYVLYTLQGLGFSIEGGLSHTQMHRLYIYTLYCVYEMYFIICAYDMYCLYYLNVIYYIYLHCL